jgi:hypothetical protein
MTGEEYSGYCKRLVEPRLHMKVMTATGAYSFIMISPMIRIYDHSDFHKSRKDSDTRTHLM